MMGYNEFKKRIEQTYFALVQDNGTYFLSRSYDVVAFENSTKNLLVLYVNANDFIWSYSGIVAVGIAKDFHICTNYNVQLADVVVFNGLYGAYNTITRLSDRLLDVNCDHVLGTKRKVSAMGNFISKSRVNFDIDIALDVTAMQYSKNNLYEILFSPYNLVYGILFFKKYPQKVTVSKEEYDVFSYFKNELWYLNNGYCKEKANELRAKIMHTQDGTNYHRTAKMLTYEI